ncbi:cytochrome P450 94B1-like [Wolffia australiana]
MQGMHNGSQEPASVLFFTAMRCPRNELLEAMMLALRCGFGDIGAMVRRWQALLLELQEKDAGDQEEVRLSMTIVLLVEAMARRGFPNKTMLKMNRTSHRRLCVTLTHLPFIFILVAGLNFAVWLILGGRRRKLDIQENGPRGYPLVGCLVSFNKNKHRLLDWHTESPIQTIVVAQLDAQRTVVTGNPENVEHILKSRFENYPKGRPFSELLSNLLGTGIFNVDGELWRAQRKLVNHEFSARMGKAAAEMALAFVVGGSLVPMLAAVTDGSTAIDLQELLRRLAIDTICVVSMGIDTSCLGSEGDDASCWGLDLAEPFDAAAGICTRRGTALVQAVWKAKRAVRIGFERVLRENLAVINDAIDMVVSFIMAAWDTTSSALTRFFWVLSQHP